MTAKTPFNFKESQMKKWKLVLILGIALDLIAVFLPVLGTGKHPHSVAIQDFGRIAYP